MVQEISARLPFMENIKLCLERKGSPEEVAKLIAFLLSDESTYCTGATYPVDGGYLA